MSDVAIIAEPVAETVPATNANDVAITEAVEEAHVEVMADMEAAATERTQIEADAAVEIAQIVADAQTEQIEALGRDRIVELETELGTCRTRITDLEAENLRLTTELSTRPPLTEQQPNPNEQQADAAAGVTPDSQEEVAAEPAKPKRPFHRWI